MSHSPPYRAPARCFSHQARASCLGGLLALALLLPACGDDKAAGAAPGRPGQGAAPPPPAVGVIVATTQAVALQTELPGRVEPVRSAQVRARVNGVVLKRHFTEGSDVRAGQALFTIDAAPYQAALDSAAAQLARARATLAQATATADRYRPLAEARAISQQDFVNAVALQTAAQADVAAAGAVVQSARINVGYTRVTAPISGRVGRALVTEGALVGTAEATPLALIQQIGSVYVNFTQSSADVLRMRRALAAGQLRSLGGGSVAVQVVLEDGSLLPQPGRLLFSDLSVDATSGQVTLRAEVPNPQGLLLPGQYVRVRLAQAELPSGILVPQQAVTRSAQGDTVMVVGEGNKPAARPVKVGSAQGGMWIVTSGLTRGERVIVDGFQKMTPGAAVNPVPWQPPGSAPASGPSALPAAAGSAATATASATSAASASTAPGASSAAASARP